MGKDKKKRKGNKTKKKGNKKFNDRGEELCNKHIMVLILVTNALTT